MFESIFSKTPTSPSCLSFLFSRRDSRRAQSRRIGSSSSPVHAVEPINAIDVDKRRVLRGLDLFVLDNSLRESIVGQTAGHTLENKLAILDAVESVGIEHVVLGAFSVARQVDDELPAALKKRGGDMSKYYAFTEDSNATEDGKMLFGTDHVPIAMQKMQRYGVPNPIIEIDLDDDSVDWDGAFPVSKLLELLTFLLKYARDTLGCRGRALVNIRDWPFVMTHHPERLYKLAQGLAALPSGASGIRPMGLLVEEPTGVFFASECAAWIRWMRQDAMRGWEGAKLLTHVHKQWGMADAVVLEMLANGADGIWCSLAEEGAAMGHACSTVTIANLARLGNEHVGRKFKTRNLAKAAVEVTWQTTGRKPDSRQVVYGPRAVEVVFDFRIGGGAVAFDTDGDGDVDEVDKFSLAKLFGLPKPPVRITTLASNRLILERLNDLFGADPQFTDELAGKMRDQMNKDLRAGIKEEYSSPTGLARLCFECGVQANDKMIATRAIELTDGQVSLLEEAKKSFYSACGSAGRMSKHVFYEFCLQPYLGCFSCDTSRVMIDSIVDIDRDDMIEWHEWRFWLVWALRSHGDEIQHLDDLYDSVFRNALLPVTLANEEMAKTQSQEGAASPASDADAVFGMRSNMMASVKGDSSP